MLTKLPTELLHIVLGHLRFRDLETLSTIPGIAHVVRHCLVRRFRFQYQASCLLRRYEGMPNDTRKNQETRHSLANQLLELICHSVEKCARQDQRAKFTELLSSLEKWVVRRVLSGELPTGMELDYADLCLDIRYMYLHRPAVRVLHDAKYRRRSTKYPLAPFLPREFTSIWRRQCNQGAQMLAKTNILSVNNAPLCRAHTTRLEFARFFGKLFKVTSLYLESNLDGTFQECVREALVSGDVESLIVMRSASGRQEDVESMCMMVSTAAEQLWSYLNSMGDLMMADPTSGQQARMVHPPVGIQDDDEDNTNDDDDDDDDEALSSPPDWLMPQRYTIHDDTRLRLKIMDELCQKGWCWFN